MEIEELKARKKVLIINIQNFIEEFEKETGVSVIGIDYDLLNVVGSKNSITINNLNLEL